MEKVCCLKSVDSKLIEITYLYNCDSFQTFQTFIQYTETTKLDSINNGDRFRFQLNNQ